MADRDAFQMYLRELALDAYRAYGESTGFKNFLGDQMPDWDKLSPKIQTAWIASVTETMRQVREDYC